MSVGRAARSDSSSASLSSSDASSDDSSDDSSSSSSGSSKGANSEEELCYSRWVFPVGRVNSDLKTHLNPMELIDRGEDQMWRIATFVTLTLEYLCAELLELAGLAAKYRGETSEDDAITITLLDLQTAIVKHKQEDRQKGHDCELGKYFGQVFEYVLGHPPGCPPEEGRWWQEPGAEEEGKRDPLGRGASCRARCSAKVCMPNVPRVPCKRAP